MPRMPAMRGKVRSIRGLRATSTTIFLIGVVLIFDGLLASWPGVARAGALAGGVVLIGIGLTLRRKAERRAATANAEARQQLNARRPEAGADYGRDLAFTLRDMAPGPADDRYERRRKEKAARAFVRKLDVTEAMGVARALARMIDVDGLATAAERERLLRLQAGLGAAADPALDGLASDDLVVLATMAADPDRAVPDGDG